LLASLSIVYGGAKYRIIYLLDNSIDQMDLSRLGNIGALRVGFQKDATHAAKVV
jgi:hypothetical protein